MGAADTRVKIATPRHPEKSTRQKRRAGSMREAMHASNDGVRQYRR